MSRPHPPKVQPLSAAALEFQNLQREKQHIQQMLDEVTDASASGGGGGTSGGRHNSGGPRREGLTKDLLEKDNKIPEKKILQDKMEKFFKEMNRSEAAAKFRPEEPPEASLPPPPPPLQQQQHHHPDLPHAMKTNNQGLPSTSSTAHRAHPSSLISPGAPSSSSSTSSRTGFVPGHNNNNSKKTNDMVNPLHPPLPADGNAPATDVPRDLDYSHRYPPPLHFPSPLHNSTGLLKHNLGNEGLPKRSGDIQVCRLSQLGTSTIPTAKPNKEHRASENYKPSSSPPPPPDTSAVSGDSPPLSPESVTIYPTTTTTTAAAASTTDAATAQEDAFKETLAERILQGKSSLFGLKDAANAPTDPRAPPNDGPSATITTPPPATSTASELSLEERIRNLDQMMERVPRNVGGGNFEGGGAAASSVDYTKFRIRKRLESTPLPSSSMLTSSSPMASPLPSPLPAAPSSAGLLPSTVAGFSSSSTATSAEVVVTTTTTTTTTPSGPSEIVKTLLGSSRRSIFDEDSRRLELIHEKYEPKELPKLDILSSSRTPVVHNPFRAKMVSLASFSASTSSQIVSSSAMSSSLSLSSSSSTSCAPPFQLASSSTTSSSVTPSKLAPAFSAPPSITIPPPTDPRSHAHAQHPSGPNSPNHHLVSPSGHSSSSSYQPRESLDQRLRDQGLLNSPPPVSPSPEPCLSRQSSSQVRGRGFNQRALGFLLYFS